MTVNVEIDFTDSYKRKTNHKLIDQCVEQTIRKVTLKAEGNCKKESPVRTGKLMRSHSTHIRKDEGQVVNRASYAGYVVHGTSRMKANNYPSRVMNRLASQKFASKTFKEELHSKGITE